MACVRVLILFSLLWVISFSANRIDATRKVKYKTLNDAMKKKGIRIRREVKDKPPCGKMDNSTVDPVNGFPQFRKQDCVVQFLKVNGTYLMKVSWKTPIGRNNSSPDGYRFWWMAYRDTNYQKNYDRCESLSRNKTSFVLHTSDDWRKDEIIIFAILPLPTKRSDGQISFNFIQTPVYTELNSTQSTRGGKSSSTNTVSTSASTQTTNGERSSQTGGNVLMNSFFPNEKRESKVKEIFTVVTVTIAATAAIALFGFVIILRFREKCNCVKPTQSNVSRDPDLIYASYISENKSHTEKVVDFGSWLRKHGYNVQMDIMLSPSNQQELRELGRLRWGAEQLSKARCVFILVSPSYLKLCRLDEGKTDDALSLTLEEKIIFSEITQMRSDLSLKAYISSRFIPVLFGVKETELPFWIKQRVVYSWPDDKMNDRLLHRIREEVSYENEDTTDNNSYLTKA